VFTDYELLQPFDQLGRSVHSLTDEERASDNLTRFLGIDVPVGKVFSLERRGWQRGRPQDAGVQQWISRPLPGGGSVTVSLDPGIAVRHIAGFGEIQRFEAVFICPHRDGSDHYPRQDYPAFSTLDPIAASELLRDLTEVTTG
jgi:hypothetical protein